MVNVSLISAKNRLQLGKHKNAATKIPQKVNLLGEALTVCPTPAN